MVTSIKKLFSDPKLYADVALCAVVLFVIIVASGKSIPQLGREALAAFATITGNGTQDALAQFTGTNTIGDATVTYMGTARSYGGVQTNPMGTHFACFLTEVNINASSGGGGDKNQCMVSGNVGGGWYISAYAVSGAGDTKCAAYCIN